MIANIALMMRPEIQTQAPHQEMLDETLCTRQIVNMDIVPYHECKDSCRRKWR